MPASIVVRLTTMFLLLSFVLPSFAQINKDVTSEEAFREDSRRPSRPDNTAKVNEVLSRMTVEEKVG